MQELMLEGLNEKIYEYKTKSGLKVYMWVNEKVNSCLMTLSVKYGSIHTKFKVGKKVWEVPNGVAHFLEHIKFNINDHTTAHDEFHKLGGDANAFTTFKYTCYTVFATTKKNENLNLLLNYVYNPYFTKKIITKEKGIIIEEANMSNDDPYSKMFYDSLKNTLQNSKFRNLITGEVEDIKKIELEHIKAVYDTFYHPKNMFLTITGNFNPYEMAQVVEENLAKKEFGEFQEPFIIKEQEPKKVNKKYSESILNIAYPRIRYMIKIPVNKFKNIELLDLKMMLNLIMNINFGATSTFKDELIAKELINTLGYAIDNYDDFIIITLSVNTNYKDEILKRIEEKFANLSITEADLTRKKNADIATLILQYDDIELVNMKIQDDILNEECIITDIKERLKSINKNDLDNVINCITLDNVSVNVFIPKENQEN